MKVYLRLQIRSGTGRLDGLAHGLDDQLVDLDIGRGLDAVADGIGHILGAQQGQVGEVDEGGLIDDLSVHSAGTKGPTRLWDLKFRSCIFILHLMVSKRN